MEYPATFTSANQTTTQMEYPSILAPIESPTITTPMEYPATFTSANQTTTQMEYPASTAPIESPTITTPMEYPATFTSPNQTTTQMEYPSIPTPKEYSPYSTPVEYQTSPALIKEENDNNINNIINIKNEAASYKASYNNIPFGTFSSKKDSYKNTTSVIPINLPSTHSYNPKNYSTAYSNGFSSKIGTKIIPIKKMEYSPVKKNNSIKIIKLNPPMNKSIIISQKLMEHSPMKRSYYFPRMKMNKESYHKRIYKSPKIRTNIKLEDINDVIRTGYKPRVYRRKI